MSDDKYLPYAQARAALRRQLHATDDEIRVWTYLGSAEGGIDAFDNPHTHSGAVLPKRHFTASEVGAYFLREQIESFTPDDSRRYLTLQALTARWEAYGLRSEMADDLVRSLIEDGCLEPINALRGHSAQVIEEGENALISDISLFSLDQVQEVEGREFSRESSEGVRTMASASVPPSWELEKPQRFDAFTHLLYPCLKDFHDRGEPIPNAQQVVEWIKEHCKGEITSESGTRVTYVGELQDSVIYYRDIAQRIGRMTGNRKKR